MSYEALIKATESLTYEEQVNLMAHLANIIKHAGLKNDNTAQIESRQKLDALDSLAGLYSHEEMKAVDESIGAGIKCREIKL